MDEFKKYLQSNKDELDGDEPQPLVWQKINTAFKPTPASIRFMPILKWAVAACIISLAGIGGWVIFNTQKSIIPMQKNAWVKQVKKQSSFNIQPAIIAKPSINNQQTIAKVNHIKSPTIKKNPKKENGLEQFFNNIETGFIQVINLQKARISTMPMYAETPAYFSDFKQQIKQMEQEEHTIKSNIVKQGLNNNLLDQLINLYQQKLTILKQLQLEMNKTNNRFKQNRGPVDSTRNYFLSI